MSITDKATKDPIAERILAAQARRPESLAQAKEKQTKGIEVARECARMLEKKFGVTRVVLYGDFLAPERLHWLSNLKLAVWSPHAVDIVKAGVAADDIVDSMGFETPEVDVLDIKDVNNPYTLKEIETEGMVL